MKDYILKNKKFVILLALGTLITSSISLLIPVLITIFKLDGSNTINYKLILFISLAMLSSLIIQNIIIISREKLSIRLNIDNSLELYNKMFKLKYSKLTSLGSSYLLDRISNIVSALYIFFCTNLTAIITNSVIVIISVILVAYYNLYLGILLLIILPINYFGYKKLNYSLAKKSILMQEKTSLGYQNILALVSNPDFIKQYSNYPYINNYISKELFSIFSSIKDVNIFAQTMSNFLRFINIYIQNIMIFVISYDTIKNELGLTPVIVVSIILPIFFNSVSEITRANISTHDLRSGIEFIKNDLKDNNLENIGIINIDLINSIEIIQSSISQNNIKFKISGDLKFITGDIVYISGASGSGKSTLLKSIGSLYENEFILYNNLCLKQLNLNTLRKRIIYVAQESVVLPTSIKENLEIGNLENNNNLYVQGISNHRLNEKIYENGKNLSGGERQRIALARALYSNPSVLLLDEITSNIDGESSKIILNDLVSSSKNKIIFITSHDKSIRNICNKEIIVEKI